MSDDPGKSTFPLADEDPPDVFILLEELLIVVGYLRTAEPDVDIRQDLRKIREKLFHRIDVPDVGGDPDSVRFQVADRREDRMDRGIDRRLIDRCHAGIDPVRVSPERIDRGIGMNILCIDGD